MNYIGSKYLLLDFINESITKYIGDDLSNCVFCDLFSGTSIVGQHFKPKVKSIISNDFEYYAYVIARNYIGNNFEITSDIQDKILALNYTKPIKGFIYQEYSINRKYFTPENGARIDGIRTEIENLKANISEDEYYYYLCILLESINKIANTSSQYSSYFDRYLPEANKQLWLQASSLINGHGVVYNEDSNQLVKKISGDICYLDIPYNSRQYGVFYHLLNTIAEYKPFVPKGKGGYPEYQRSKYCFKNESEKTFEELIDNLNFKWIVASYNNEGIIPFESFKKILENRGEYFIEQKEYAKYKTGKTIEYLHIVRVANSIGKS